MPRQFLLFQDFLEEEMEALPTTTVWKGEPEKHVARFLSERITEDAGCDSL